MTRARQRFLARRGPLPDAPATLYAWDIETGAVQWRRTEGVFGTWLAYEPSRGVVLEAGSRYRDRASDEVGRGMTLYDGATGEVRWHHDEVYGGPPLLHPNRIVTQSRAFSWDDGRPWQRIDPLSGERSDWVFRRNHGCNTIIGCRTMLTFRSAAAGFFDLASDGGTGNFGGFRSSCTANLVPADGVLAAPDYTRTCVCSYHNRTSLALGPVPEIETWTFLGTRKWAGHRIRSLGINLGAPGDFRSADDLLWLDSPSVGGPSPQIDVKLEGDIRYVRHHALRLAGDRRQVAASGAVGVRRLRVALARSRADDRSRAEEGRTEEDRARYDVELVFAEIDGASRGQRIFDLFVNGKRVGERIDVVQRAGGPMKSWTLKVGEVPVGKELDVELRRVDRSKREPLLCGVAVRMVEAGS